MRQVILDTETTGLSWERGCRVVEIGCVEFVERRPTGRTFHRYLNPDCDFEPGAAEVTGLTLDFLSDKPRFSEVIDEFLEFIEGAELIIHNAAFDIGFLDNELRLCGAHYGCISNRCRIEDTLLMARKRYTGQRNSLDALCRRLGIDNSHRQLHGALLDAQLLAEVYIGLTSGQTDLGFGDVAAELASEALPFEIDLSRPRPRVRVEAEELQAHEARLAVLRKKSGAAVWDRFAENAGGDEALAPA
ncbi:DNA polymerase III subunit epsilon [Lysobacter xinjiangensis]|uniref:DNA polymerase III subunit epsilon n=1 Tax=Cognatilysobacter xinjiangensis TaxID=546892 RepID=A0ABQ3BZA0_9GAMM|nr:DNA polymerase III subunit epsilon [Lysobacter xinjiangensis]GGZ61729.1 DNA polymerase III subunit epsilon [Lysobacter xinjiangensis]